MIYLFIYSYLVTRCCWILYLWCIWPLYWCFLGMAVIKSQRYRLITEQLTQRPVTTPGLPITTLKRLNITQGRMLPQAQFTTEEPKHYSAPRYHQTEAPVNYTTNASECYMIINAVLNYYTGASKCNTINVQPICKQG